LLIVISNCERYRGTYKTRLASLDFKAWIQTETIKSFSFGYGYDRVLFFRLAVV